MLAYYWKTYKSVWIEHLEAKSAVKLQQQQEVLQNDAHWDYEVKHERVSGPERALPAAGWIREPFFEQNNIDG